MKGTMAADPKVSAALRFRPKIFIRASHEAKPPREPERDVEVSGGGGSKGREASQFYRDVLAQDSTSKERRHGVRKGRARVVKTAARQRQKRPLPRDLMAAAERDDVDGLAAILEGGQVGVDVRDDFGWSALMVAACAGSQGSVRALLAAGADHGFVDRAGNDAGALAAKRGHRHVAAILKRHEKSRRTSKTDATDRGKAARSVENAGQASSVYCATCETEVPAGTSHVTSTVHQFKVGEGSAPRPTLYGIPDANRGFQMMLEGGWNRERGLGPEGREGKKFPVKTILKRDRLGLGAEGTPRPRVTHFGPNDAESVVTRREKRLQERTERRATILRRDHMRAKVKDAAKEQVLRQELGDL